MATSTEHVSMHRRVTEALESGVHNRDWFLWVDVSGDDARPDFSSLVAAAEQWLGQMDPDAEPGEGPELQWARSNVSVLLKALPKKPHARGADPLVGNPFPAFAYWVAS